MSGDALTDERLRAAYAAHLRARDARLALDTACVAPEALLALVRREGAESDRLAVLDHVMACARCQREFDLLHALEIAAQEAAGQEAAGQEAVGETARTAGDDAPRDAAVPRRVLPITAGVRATLTTRAPRRWRGLAGLALAASVVLAVGVTRGFRTFDADPAREVERGAPEGVMLVAPAGEADVPVHLLWRSVPHAIRYEVEVLAPDGAVALAGTTSDTAFAVDDVRRLTPGVAYRWWVHAVTDDGGATRRSELRTLRVRAH